MNGNLPFVQLVPGPAGSDYMLAIGTNSLTDVGIWTISLNALSIDYPAMTSVQTTIQLEVQHPCVNTKLFIDPPIAAMNYTLGTQELTSSFKVTDSFSTMINGQMACGAASCEPDLTYSFMQIMKPLTTSNDFKIYVSTSD